MVMNSIFNILVSGIGVALTAYTIVPFVTFISFIPYQGKTPDQGVIEWDLLSATWALMQNIMLLSLFVFQHSVMADIQVKQFMKRLGLEAVERSVYIIATSFSLLILISNWQRIPLTIWNMPTVENHTLWWCFTLLHCYMWFLIYGGSLMVDLPELLGIKQVYYHIKGFEHPLRYKSTEVCRVYQHMRHPSFTCFFILFWVHPYMSLDRLLLSIIWTLYMILAWNLDSLDYNYHHKELSKKQIEFCRTRLSSPWS